MKLTGADEALARGVYMFLDVIPSRREVEHEDSAAVHDEKPTE